MTISNDVFLTACLVGAYTDVRKRRVPNILTFGAMAAVVVATVPIGLIPVLASVGAIAGTIILGSIAFGYGICGGGDIKLLAVGAGAVGYPACLVLLLYITCTGGLLAAIYALQERRLRTVVTHVALSVLHGTRVVPATDSRRLPYALAIGAGSLCYFASESAPWFRFVH